ncbi:MAG: Na(+)/H(+) antiporter subunit D [Gammaproteobacteria bacterium]
MTELPPFLFFYLGALLVPLLRGSARNALMLSIPLFCGWALFHAEPGAWVRFGLFDYDLVVYRVDALSLLFGYLFSIASFLSILFSLHLRGSVQHMAGMSYAGSALGVVFAGDLLSLFVFWELMGLTSVFLIWARGSSRSIRAGLRYFFFQLLSGVLLLAGILWRVQDTGSLDFGFIGLHGPDSWLIFLAFGIKCAFPLLHNWLTDTYPEATATGTVFLSAFTTKAAIYALARAFPGIELLIYIGATMTCFPIFYAVIENDLRRVLSYSMINQLGFMVCGIGIGSALAVNGAVAHACTDVIFKGLLFMSMGAVLHVTGRIKGSELGGLYKTMPITTALCLVGAASISAFPLFSGFVSKSMVMSAALQEGYDGVWLVLLFASAGVFHHAGIKIPFFAFFAHDLRIKATEPRKNMLAAMALAAALCVIIGCYPWPLYALLPERLDYTPYDASHVIAQLQLLFFSALAFIWLKRTGLYPPERGSVNLDIEVTYRKWTPQLLGAWARWLQGIAAPWHLRIERASDALTRRIEAFRSALVGSQTTGDMALSVTALLALWLLFLFATVALAF